MNRGLSFGVGPGFLVLTKRSAASGDEKEAAETLEYTCEHAHSKILVEPKWQKQHGNHHFGRHVGFVFEEDSSRQKSPDYRDVIVFEKLRFQNVFRPH